MSQIGTPGAHKEFLSDESAIGYERSWSDLVYDQMYVRFFAEMEHVFLIRCPCNWTILVSFAFHPTSKDKQRPWRELGQLGVVPTRISGKCLTIKFDEFSGPTGNE